MHNNLHKNFAKLQLLALAISGASTLCRIWVVRILWFWRLFDLWWPISPKELKLSCGLVLPAAAETPTCFTIWCRFFIWSLTQDTQIFYGDQVELMLLTIPVTLETSPFWIYNPAHQRTQEVSSPTLLHKDRVGSSRKTKEQQAPCSS